MAMVGIVSIIPPIKNTMHTKKNRLPAMIYGLILLLGSTIMTVEWILVLPGYSLMEDLSRNHPVSKSQAHLLATMPGHIPEAARQRAAGLTLLGQWDQAQQQQEKWLTLSPADAYGYLRLSIIARMAKDTDTSARALEMAFGTGRHERELMLPRLLETVAQWNRQEHSVRDMALNDLAMLWRWDRPRLTQSLPVNKAWPLYSRALSGTAAFAEAMTLRSTPQTKQQGNP